MELKESLEAHAVPRPPSSVLRLWRSVIKDQPALISDWRHYGQSKQAQDATCDFVCPKSRVSQQRLQSRGNVRHQSIHPSQLNTLKVQQSCF